MQQHGSDNKSKMRSRKSVDNSKQCTKRTQQANLES